MKVKILLNTDGTIESTVSGVKGGSCEKVMAEIEAALGFLETEKSENTPEFYQQPLQEHCSNKA